MHFLASDGDNVTVSKFLNTLDFFAHGRKDGETFGAVFAEAMIHGKPCLSHHSETGLDAQKETMGTAGLFAIDEKDYTEKLYSLFSDKKLRDKLASEAKKNSKQYSIESAIQEVIKVYEEILSDPSRFKIKIDFLSKAKDFIFQYVVFLYKTVRGDFRKVSNKKL